MKLVLNGETTEVPDGLTICGLLEHLQIKAARVAVEVNLQVIRRERHSEHRLAEGDTVEVVTFVGGG